MDQELALGFYKKMLLIRRFEEEAARLYTERKIGGFLHLYIGQEATAVGAITALKSSDLVITAYRCHAHYLAKGGSARAGMAELLGKETGCSRGRGGSMHFFDAANRFMGGWAIVGGQIPIAAGLAFANKYHSNTDVVLCFLGDGAINIGSFHEGLSLSALWNLPVIYIIENNQFAMGTPLEKTFPIEDLSIRALGYPMARERVDGHDVFAMHSAISAATKRVREQQQPMLIEAKTYRYRGHSMADPGKYRNKEEIEKWRIRDPISTLAAVLDSANLETLRKKIELQIEEEIEDAVQYAENSPFPAADSALDYVYA